MMERSNFENFVDWMEINYNKEFHVILKRIEEWLHSSASTAKKEGK